MSIKKAHHHSGRAVYYQENFVWTVTTQDDGDVIITPAWGAGGFATKTPLAEVLAALGYKEPDPPRPLIETAQAQSPLGGSLPVTETSGYPAEPDFQSNDPDIVPPRRRK